MKKMLIIIIAGLTVAQAGNAGINYGGIPGNFTADSLASKHARVVAGGVDPGLRKASPSISRGHRPRLQRRLATR